MNVYEEEQNFFYEDRSDKMIDDDKLALLLMMPNVIVTSHQAFFTREAMHNIATTTLQNIADWAAGRELKKRGEMTPPKGSEHHQKPLIGSA